MASQDPTQSLLDRVIARQQNNQIDTTNAILSPKQVEVAQATQRQMAMLDEIAERNRNQQSILNLFDEDANYEAILSGGLVNSDTVRQLGGNFVSGVGTAARSLGDTLSNDVPSLLDSASDLSLEATDALGLSEYETVTDPETGETQEVRRITAPEHIGTGINTTLGTVSRVLGGSLLNVGNALESGGKAAETHQSFGTARTSYENQITGDILEPSTWSMGTNPSLGGFIHNVIGAIGGTSPQLVGAALTKGSALTKAIAAGSIGGVQAGQGAADHVGEIYSKLTPEEMEKEIPLFKELIEAGYDPESAKTEVIKQAKIAAGITAGAIATLAGGALQTLITAPGRQFLKQFPKLNESTLARAAVLSTATTAAEGLTEVAESELSIAASNFVTGDDLKATNTFQDLILGAAVGGVISGPSVFKTIVVENRARELINQVNALRTSNEIASGNITDLTPYTSINSPQFDPSIASNAILMADDAVRGDLINSFNAAAENAFNEYESKTRALDPETGVERAEGYIRFFEEKISETNNEEEIAQLNDAIAKAKENIEIIKNGESETILKGYRERLTKLEEAYANVQDWVSTDVLKNLTRTTKDMEEAIQQGNTAAAEESFRQSAAMITRNPTVVGAKQLHDVIRKAPANANPETLRTLQAIAETQTQVEKLIANNTSKVHNNIINGNEEWRGIQTFRKSFMTALSRGDFKSAAQTGASLVEFRKHHEQKANLAAQLLQEFAATGKARQMLPLGKGKGWVRAEKNLPFALLRHKKGLRIDGNSQTLINAMAEEVIALNLAEQEFRHLYRASQNMSRNTNAPVSATEPVINEEVNSNVTESPAPTSTVTEEATQEATQEPAQEVSTPPNEETTEPAAPAAPVRSRIPAYQDVLLRENWGRINSVTTVENFIKGLPLVLSEISSIPEDDRTDAQTELLLLIGGDMTQPTYDWEMIINESIYDSTPEEIFDAESSRLMDLVNETIPQLQEIYSKAFSDPEPEPESEAPITSVVTTPNDTVSVNPVDPAVSTEESSIPVEMTPESALEVDPLLDPNTDETLEISVDASAKQGITALINASQESLAADGTPLPVNAETYANTNLMKRFFRFKTNNTPLNTIKDFMKSPTAEILERFLPMDKRKGDLGLFEVFKSMKQRMQSVLDSIPAVHTGQTNIDDKALTRYFDDGSGKLEDNVQTAMVFAATAWLVEASTVPMTLDTAHRVTGKDPEGDQKLTAVGYRDLIKFDKNIKGKTFSVTAVANRSSVIERLGNYAYEALGITNTIDAPKDLKQRLITDLGIKTLHTLESTGLVYSDTRNVLFSDGTTQNYEMIGLAPKGTNHRHWITSIKEYAKDGGMADLTRLFLSRKEKDTVTFTRELPKGKETKGTFNQKTKDDGLLVTELQKKAERSRAGDNWKVNSSTASVWSMLSTSAQMTMAGAVEVTENTHSNVRDSREAANENLRRNIEDVNEVIGQQQVEGDTFRFNGSVWAQNRVGQLEKAGGQVNKVARALFQIDEWTSTVPTSSAEIENKIFRVGISEALGIKVDDTNLEGVLESFNLRIMLDPGIQEAINIINMPSRDDEGTWLTPEDEAVLVREVVRGGEGMHSFAALIALAEYSRALNEEQESFETAFPIVVDGKTNGIILALMNFGVTSGGLTGISFADAGGFFTDPTITNYGDYKSKGGQDVYQSAAVATAMAEDILDTSGKNPTSKKGKHIRGILKKFTKELVKRENNQLIPTKEGRNFFKPIVTKFGFGSGAGSVNNTIVESVTENYFDMFERILNSNSTDAQKIGRINAMHSQLNEVINYGAFITHKVGNFPSAGIRIINPNSPNAIQQVRQIELTDTQLRYIQQAVKHTLGKAVNTALNLEYAKFVGLRRNLNDLANTVTNMYIEVYEQVEAAYIQELIDSGVMPTTKTGAAVFALNAQQEAELVSRLEAIYPAVDSPFSKADNAGKMSGLSWLNYESDFDARKRISVPVGINPNGKTKESSAHIKKYKLMPPGVKAIINAIHSLDSMIASAIALENVPVLNVHDAAVSGPAQVLDVVNIFGRATFNNLANYNIPLEIMNSVSSILNNILDENSSVANYLPNGKEAIKKITQKVLNERSERMGDHYIPLDSILRETKSLAEAAIGAKEALLSNVTTIAQYSFPIGLPAPSSNMKANLAAQSHIQSVETPIEIIENGKRVEHSVRNIAANLSSIIAKQATRIKEQPAFNREVHAKLVKLSKSLVESTISKTSLMQKIKGVGLSQHASSLISALIAPNAEVIEEENFLTAQVLNSSGEYLQGLLLSALESATEGSNQAQALSTGVILSRENPSLTLGEMELTDMPVSELVNIYRDASPVFASVNGSRVFMGTVGESTTPVNTALKDLFTKSNTVSKERLLKTLKQEVEKSPNKVFLKPLLLLIESRLKNVPLTVGMVTPDNLSDISEGSLEMLGTAPAIYINNFNGMNEIYFKSDEFTEHGLFTEAVIHELLHAITFNQIEGVKSGKIKDRAAIDAVEDLEKVRSLLIDYINKLPGDARTGEDYESLVYAAKDIHELVAMSTNPAVMEVLSNLSMPAVRNNVINALKSLVISVIKLFSGKQSKPFENGYAHLLNSVLILSGTSRVSIQGSARMAASSAMGAAEVMTSEELFNKLVEMDNSTPATFIETLRNGMNLFIDNILNSDLSSTTSTYSGDTQYIQQLLNNNTNYVNGGVSSSIKMSLPEQFMTEQAYITMEASLRSNFPVNRELTSIYRNALSKIKVEDFITDNTDPYASLLAKEKYDYVFGLGLTGINPVAHFGSLVMGSAEVNRVLNKVIGAEPSTQVESWFNKATNMISRTLHNTSDSMPVANRVNNLLNSLAQAQVKYRIREAKKAESLVHTFQSTLDGVVNNTRGSIGRLGRSPLFQNNGRYLKTVGNVLQLSGEGNLEALIETTQEMGQAIEEGKNGTINGLLTEAVGQTDSNSYAHDLFNYTKQLELGRSTVVTAGAKILSGAFKGLYESFTDKEKSAITDGLVRTDIAAIATDRTNQQLGEFLLDDVAIANEISALETQIKAAPVDELTRKIWLDRSEALAIFMNNSRVGIPVLVTNAANIANNLSIGIAVNPRTAEQFTPVINKLVTLYAFRDLNPETKRTLRNIIRADLAQNNGEGISTVIKYHKHTQESAQNSIFNNSGILMRKGYVAEVHQNEHTLSIARNDPDVKEHIARGYQIVGKLSEDKLLDPTHEGSGFLMVIPDGGQVGRITGAFSTTSKRTMGTNVFSPFDDQAEIADAVKKRTDAYVNSIRNGTNVRPSDSVKRGINYTVPSFDLNGNVTNLRYVMSRSTRENALGLENSFDKVLPETAAKLFNKTSGMAHNESIVDALKSVWDAEKSKNPNRYLRVSYDSNNPELQELWALLPEETRNKAEETFGGRYIMVRKDLLNMFFGYRKKSLSSKFNVSAWDRAHGEALLVTLAETVFGKKVGLRVKQGGDVWQALVNIVKDVRVIRNFTTLAGNVMSNLSIVWVYGMPWDEVIKKHAEGVAAAIAWDADNHEYTVLKQSIDMGVLPSSNENLTRLRELEVSLSTNPLIPLINAGLFQTIVEDVEVGRKENQHLQKIYNNVNEFTDSISPTLTKGLKEVIVAPSSSTYKFLHKATRMSDLISRYALYSHLTGSSDSAMTEAEAIKEVREAFVNYDLPSSPWVQYANDMGAVMFTKYYLRIAKVMTRLMNKHAARLMMIGLLDSYTDNIGLITDSFIWNKLGNLLEPGAIEILDVLDEPFPLAMANSLLR